MPNEKQVPETDEQRATRMVQDMLDDTEGNAFTLTDQIEAIVVEAQRKAREDERAVIRKLIDSSGSMVGAKVDEYLRQPRGESSK